MTNVHNDVGVWLQGDSDDDDNNYDNDVVEDDDEDDDHWLWWYCWMFKINCPFVDKSRFGGSRLDQLDNVPNVSEIKFWLIFIYNEIL